MNVIFIIGIFIAFFQFVLLLNKKAKSLPDKLLATWMLVISIHLLSYHLYQLGYWDKYPHLVGITTPFPLFYGPLLFLYVSHSLKNEKKLSKTDYLHFLPILLSYVSLFKFYFFYTAAEKRLIDSGALDDFQGFYTVWLVAFILSGIGYAVFSYRKINTYSALLDDNFSNTEDLDLNWLKSLIWGVGILFTMVLLLVVSTELLGLEINVNTDYIIYSTLILGILFLGYFGIRHKDIFSDRLIVDLHSKDSYLKSGLKEEEAKRVHKLLLNTMEEEKPYLKPKLSLNHLAELLSISSNHLSQIINQFEKKNFNDFVNQYRVEEFIHLASEKSQYSFLALALEAGFNSKSTFNKIFKKIKGMTPSEYLAKREV